jgi:hypothetical protein
MTTPATRPLAWRESDVTIVNDDVDAEDRAAIGVREIRLCDAWVAGW